MYRSFHFIPADNLKFLENINKLSADNIILDLEDSVDFKNKDIARKNIDNLFNNLSDFSKFWIRCNSVDSGEFSKDITLLEKYPNIGLVLPKIELVKDLEILLSLKNKRIIILIESFKGLNNISLLADNTKIVGIGLGLEDLLVCLPRSEKELSGLVKAIYQKFIISVKQYDKFCLAGITNNYKDNSQLVCDCKQEVSYGFDGKFSIHPSQIETINFSFSLPKEAIQWAEKIKKLSNLDKSSGYQIIDNKLITPPKIKKARAILNIMEKL